MTIELPTPIDTFVRAENSGDFEAMTDCFVPFATLRDEDRFVEGLPAIKASRARAKRRCGHTVTPLEVKAVDGDVTLKVELSGTFLGSPMTADFHFVLVDDKIASLRIRA